MPPGEFCVDHKELNERTIRIDENVRILVLQYKEKNNQYEEHLKESNKFRTMIIQHEKTLKDICDLKRWWLGAVITVLFGLLSLAVIWGGLLVKVTHLERTVYATEK